MFKSAFVIVSAFLIVTTYGSDNEEDLIGKASKKLTEITELAKNTIGNIGKEKSIFDNIVSDRESILDDLPAGINASSIPSIEEGEDLIRKKCLQHGRNDTFDDIKAAEEELKYCIMDLFNFDTIQEEIEKYKPTGDLDIVFKKYCRKMPKVKSCIQNFTVAIDPCLNEQEKDAKQLIVNITESLDRFICFKEGDRIALFIAEGGPDCLSDKQEAIQHCVNETFTSEVPDINDLPTFKLQEPECRNINNFQRCVVSELEKCSEPTPANIVDSLINYVRQSTPCSQYKAEGETSSAAIKYVNVFTLISSLFVLILNIKQ